MPNERMSLQVELATEASSSTTITSFDSIAFAFGATVMTNLEGSEVKFSCPLVQGKGLAVSGRNESVLVLVLDSKAFLDL
jgi:hypothetical protein